MAGLGVLLFVLPPFAGWIIAAALSLSPRLRFLASYAVSVPMLGAIDGFVGMNVGASSFFSLSYLYGTDQSWLAAHFFLLAFIAGYGIGMSAGILTGSWLSPLARGVSGQ